MTYATELAAASRTPITLFVLDMDYCTRTFGVAPCLATGVQCYNTRGTCKYTSAYAVTTKEYKFSSADAPLPFAGPRPYLKSVNYLATEIKTALTVNGRATVELYDEPDGDIGTDPYLGSRAVAPQGTYWRKFLARNPHYKGRTAHIYAGFLGLAENAFVETWRGLIENITISRGTVKVEIVDTLKALDKIEIPAKSDIKLLNDFGASVITSITVSTLTGLDAPAGYIRIDDEIMHYGSQVLASNQLVLDERHSAGTTDAAHTADTKVQRVVYYPPTNGFDLLKSLLLTDAGMDAANVASTDFDNARDNPGGEPLLSALIDTPTKLSDLYFEIVDLLDCKSWVGEDLAITIRRNLPNYPGRTYTTLTDEANIVKDSGSVDLNAASRISRCLLFWEKTALKDAKEQESYQRGGGAVDVDAESAAEYGEEALQTIYCRWLRLGYAPDDTVYRYIANLTAHRVASRRDPLPILQVSVETKDAGILTGDYIKATTDEIPTSAGAPSTSTYEVIKRQNNGPTIQLKLLRVTPRHHLFIAQNAFPDDWHDGTDAQKEYGGICADTGVMSDGSVGYTIY